MRRRAKRKSGANPVRSRHCNWRDALPAASCGMPFKQPLPRCGREGGAASLSAISQEACRRRVPTALRGIVSGCPAGSAFIALRRRRRKRGFILTARLQCMQPGFLLCCAASAPSWRRAVRQCAEIFPRCSRQGGCLLRRSVGSSVLPLPFRYCHTAPGVAICCASGFRLAPE